MSHPLARLIGLAALAALLSGLVPIQPAQAEPVRRPVSHSYVVNRYDDPVRAPAFGCRTVPNGGCSLRDAILASNTNPGVDTIVLEYGAIYQLSIPPIGPDDGTTGDLHITQSVNFAFGNTCSSIFFCTANISGSPSWTDRLLTIDGGAVVNMSSIVFEYGHILSYGGAIELINNSTLTLTNSIVYSNTALLGGGIYSQGTLYIGNSVVFYNEAAQNSGGGIEADASASSLVIDQSYIENNTAQTYGGGVFSATNTRISRTTISGNDVTGNGSPFLGGGGLY